MQTAVVCSVFDLITSTAVASSQSRDLAAHLTHGPSFCHCSNTYAPPGTSRLKLWSVKTVGFGYQGERDNSNNCASNLASCLPWGCNRRRGDNVREHNGSWSGRYCFQANWTSLMPFLSLRCSLGKAGLLKEESGALKENLTCPWHLGSCHEFPRWTSQRATNLNGKAGLRLFELSERCKRRLLNLYWYCWFSLSSVWHSQKPQRGWKRWLKRAVAFHEQNRKHSVHYHAYNTAIYPCQQDFNCSIFEKIFSNDNVII